MINSIIDFYLKSHPVTLGVLTLLSIYFIVLNWVFFYRYFSINNWLNIENRSLESLLMGSSTVDAASFLNNFLKTSSNIIVAGKIDGVVECSGEYMIFNQIGNGAVYFNQESVKLTQNKSLKLIYSKDDNLVVKELE